MTVDRLFRPLRLREVELANRIVFAAHLTNFATDRLPGPRHAAYYAARAAGGAGLVVTEEFSVAADDQPYEKTIAGHSPRVDAGSRALTDAVHAAGAPVFAQLNHNGGQAGGLYSRRPVRAADAVADPLFREVPQPLDAAGLAEIVETFAATAGRCAANGFDGVEIQASQASLLRGFLSRATNRRTDGYGGSPAARARLLLEVVAVVREAVGPGRVVGVRLGADEGVADGLTVDEAVAVAVLLEATGDVDYLSTTLGLATATLHRVEPPMGTPPGASLPLARAVTAAVRLPVLGVGRFTRAEQAEAALAAGDCELVGIVRGQIADPEFAAKSRRGEPVRTCLGCNQDCIGRVGVNAPLSCVVNPTAGREQLPVPASRRPMPATRTPAQRHVVVVGGGPAGLRAAAAAAWRGRRVTLLEREAELGGQLALAARAPARGEFGALVEDTVRECRDLDVALLTSSPADVPTVLALAPDAVVVATGSRPRRPGWVPTGLLAERVLDVRDVLGGASVGGPALGGPALGDDVVLVDETGGHAATSVAELLVRAGVAVEIVTPGLVVGQDLALTLDLAGWKQRTAGGVVETTGTLVLAADAGVGPDDELTLTLFEHLTGTIRRRSCSGVVVAGPGRVEDGLWRALAGQLPAGVALYRAGDCVAPRWASTAVRDGERVGAAV